MLAKKLTMNSGLQMAGIDHFLPMNTIDPLDPFVAKLQRRFQDKIQFN